MTNADTVNRRLVLIERALDKHAKDQRLPFGLFGGTGGVSLFYYTLYSATRDVCKLKKAIDYLNDSISRFEEAPFLPTYCSGLAGLAALMVLFAKEGVTDYSIGAEVNDYLLDSLREFLEKKNLDFLHGAIGIATYFVFLLSLFPGDKCAISATNLVLEKLSETREVYADSCKWAFCDGINPPEYNISMSHGMSAIVCYLSRLLRLKYETDVDIKTLCRSSINFINSQMIDVERYGSFYPYASLDGADSFRKSRLAWCYGDLGVALAQYNAGIVLKDECVLKHALSVLSHSANNRREPESNGIVDAGLCHGASGVAQCYYRLFSCTNIPAFKDAADYWIEVVMNLAQGEDYAGYSISNPRGEDYHSIGLLEGISGIGLSLISYLYKDSFQWDSILNITL